MPKYTAAPKEVAALVDAIIAEHYPELDTLRHPEAELPPLRFDLCFAYAELNANGDPKSAAVVLNGYPCAAIIRRIGLKDRVLGRGDVEITIDAEKWEELDDEGQAALIDHELYHLEPRKDDEGVFARDDLHRPLFGMRRHDVQIGWFAKVAERHGKHSMEQRQAREIFDEFGQAFFPFVTAPKPKSKKRQAAAEREPADATA